MNIYELIWWSDYTHTHTENRRWSRMNSHDNIIYSFIIDYIPCPRYDMSIIFAIHQATVRQLINDW